MTRAVDEKGRRAINAAAYSAHEILVNPIHIGMLGQRALHLGGRNAQQRHVFGQMLITERVLMRIKHIVHLPEFMVRGRRLRNLSGMLGMGMDFGQRKVTKNKPEVIPQLSPNFVDDRVGHAAVGAFVVAIFDQCYRRVCWPAYMIAFANRSDQVSREMRSHFLSSYFGARSSRAARMPSAPGFTPTGET